METISQQQPVENNSTATSTKVKKPDYEPKHNSEYGKQEYWEQRFAQEDEYEWLVNYK